MPQPWNKKEHPEVICVTCGKSFNVKPYLVDTRKYCSRKCKSVFDKERFATANANRSDRWTPEEIEIMSAQFPTTLTENMLPLLPRHSLLSINTKARHLGLKKTQEYRKAYLAQNRVNAIEALKGSTPWNKQEPIHKICATCGNAFDVPLNRKDKAICCSVKCLNVWKKTIQGTSHPLYKAPAERVCQWCGNPFQCKPAKVTYGEGIYCSRHCLGSAKTAMQNGRKSSLEVAVEQVLISLNEPFEPQKKIGWWSVDFYLPERNLIIECDGKYWHSIEKVAKRDIRKDAYLQKHGYQILRIGEDAIKANAMEAVQQGIHISTPSMNDL